jgi:hypothetical protein
MELEGVRAMRSHELVLSLLKPYLEFFGGVPLFLSYHHTLTAASYPEGEWFMCQAARTPVDGEREVIGGR